MAFSPESTQRKTFKNLSRKNIGTMCGLCALRGEYSLMVEDPGPNYPFVHDLGLPVATAGLGYPDTRAHAPNENIRIALSSNMHGTWRTRSKSLQNNEVTYITPILLRRSPQTSL
jgi:hypothetical protein